MIIINVQTNLVEFYPSIFKILSGNEILTSIKGCNSRSVTNLGKKVLTNPNLNLVNVKMYSKCCKILDLSIHFQDIEGNEILTSIKGHYSEVSVRYRIPKNDL